MNDFTKMRTDCSCDITMARLLMVVFGVLALIAVRPLKSFGNESKGDWQWTDIKGKLHKPFEDPSTTGIVLVFISTDCPIANSYQPLLRRLHEAYTEKGIRLFQVHPHSQTSVEEARKHATEFGIQSPILIDPDQSLSRRIGATATPEAFVFARDENLPVYQGRIDNRYAGYGKTRKVATTNDLADVLDRLVDGQPIAPQKTKAVGCLISFKHD